MGTSIADRVRFDAQGLVPVAITDAETCRLLVLCYMNREALEQTLADGRVHLYRRSQRRVALKGETSGHVQEVTQVRVNCDGNSLEMRVRQRVAACHAGYYSCFYRRWDAGTGEWVVDDERCFDPERVYT
ncbi:MAG: phosphoribosyl-AMP cyclohydrolase [Gemmatimonadota bacterium]